MPAGSWQEIIIEAIRPIAVTNIAGPPENDSDLMAEGRRPAHCPARPGKAGKGARPPTRFLNRGRP